MGRCTQRLGVLHEINKDCPSVAPRHVLSDFPLQLVDLLIRETPVHGPVHDPIAMAGLVLRGWKGQDNG